MSIEEARQHGLEQARHLGTDLDRAGGFRLADEFRFIRNGLRRDGDDFNLGCRLHRSRSGFLLATGRHDPERDNRQHAESNEYG